MATGMQRKISGTQIEASRAAGMIAVDGSDSIPVDGRRASFTKLLPKGRLTPALAILVAILGIADAAEPTKIAVVKPARKPKPEPETRVVEVIDREAMHRAAADSVAGVLEELSSVTVQQRGSPGVQSDLSLRGADFRQVLVAFDGIPLADPQTAHHNMDLPFPLDSLEQIKVVPGPAPIFYGPGAVGGVVDLIPRRPTTSGMRILSALGSFETIRGAASADVVQRPFSGTFSSSYATSDGFQDGTDYEIWSAAGSLFREYEGGDVRFSIGHVDKDFGAQDFYAAFPSREQTSATFVDLAPSFPLGDWKGKAALRYRRHEDEFILSEEDPSLLRNEHTSDTYTERAVMTSPRYALGSTQVGVERTDGMLDSSNLGDRDQNTSSFFAEQRTPSTSWEGKIGVRVDRHNRWGTEVSPAASVSIPCGRLVSWRAAAARAIRPPTFTELYYEDPLNHGNPDLEPEEARGFETGIDLRDGDAKRASFTVFHRETDNLVDWVRNVEEDPWEATNLGEATFRGIEAQVGNKMRAVGWRAGYRYTDVDTDSHGLESKYALNVARHDLNLGADLGSVETLSATIDARYRDVPTLDSYWAVNARLARQFSHLLAFVSAQNLLDEDYEEIPGVSTAGTYVEAGVEMSW